jgi:ferredoxin
MKTEFSLSQLADPDIAEADKILRKCVHCGFCTATCPTYVLLGDELDSPRGRIYLMKEMLEKNQPPTEEVVKHIDRCLSCLACMTTCPSGVNYMHLVDQARVRIEREYRRPLPERLLRSALALVLPRPAWFRFSMRLARLAGRWLPCCRQQGLRPRRACWGGSGRCWRWPRAACHRPAPQLAACSRPQASGADGSRCCRGVRSRFWHRGSIRPPSMF